MTYAPVTKRSRLLFHWRAADLTLDPITGQADTFARATTATGVTDSSGSTYTVTVNQPAWQATSSEPGLLLGANDSLYWAYSAVPQTMTAYVKFVERGSAQATGAALLHIGSATAASDARFVVNVSSSNYYQLTHDNGSAVPSVSLAATPTAGAAVEVRAVLNADGSVIVGQSIGGAAESTASTATAATLAAAWAGTRLYINSAGTTSIGSNEFRVVKVAPGVQTMAAMRSLY